MSNAIATVAEVNLMRGEYPRPQMVRNEWKNLNGSWDFRFDFGNSGVEREFYIPENFKNGETLKINVPFCPESRLSGIGYTDYIPAVWYMRSFTLTGGELAKGRTLLHFGAVDYRCVVWINGKNAGEHTGGYSSFEFDITDLVHEGENIIALYAEDDLRSKKQPFGKQSDRYESYACSYTRTTGIWMTVWLEFVPENYIEAYKATPLVGDSSVGIETFLRESDKSGKLSFKVLYEGVEVGNATAEAVNGYAETIIRLDGKMPVKLWEPGSPVLYDLEITLAGTDKITGYFGMRSVEIHPDALYLNGKPFFMRTVLDQGFNPEGVYTAPSDEFLKRDIELSMKLGFNGARLHQRVFEERTLYWADKLGYVVWGEYANGNLTSDERGLGCFLPEWLETVKRDYNHPAIIGWCPDNESYWEHDIDGICQRTVYSVTKAFDPTRPVIDASGGLHFVTDMFDIHEYEQKPEILKKRLEPMLADKNYFHNPLHNEVLRRMKYEGQPYWISEYGGTFWNPDIREGEPGWGYGENPKTEEEFAERFESLTRVLLECPRVCGFCYTQLTDVEQEQNGLLRYDRSPKFSPWAYEKIAKALKGDAACEKKE